MSGRATLVQLNYLNLLTMATAQVKRVMNGVNHYSVVGRGTTNKEIAQLLYITVNTVRNHLVRIYTKLDADNRTQAVIKNSTNVLV